MSVYLDYNATTPVLPAVQKAVAEALPVFGNPSSTHGAGRQARMLLDDARRQVAECFNVRPEQVVFTSGGTEANVMALRGVCEPILDAVLQGKTPQKNVLIVSEIEHPSVYNTAKFLEKRGLTVKYLPVSSKGIIQTDILLEWLKNDDVALVSIMSAHNETGIRQPIGAVRLVCEKLGVLCHTDAVQVAGKTGFVLKNEADAASISFHKLGGLKGCGALITGKHWAQQAENMYPLLTGGAHERNRRAGTENMSGIVAAGAAAQAVAQRNHEGVSGLHLRSLQERLESGLKAAYPDVVIAGEGACRLENTTYVMLPAAAEKNISSDTLVMALDVEGFEVSGGSACASGRVEPSRSILAMGYAEPLARTGLRVSYGEETTTQNIDGFLAALHRILQRAGCY